jgi:hypothetical protein
MKRLDAAYLRRLVGALSSDEAVSTALRNECHRLMMAIDSNKLTLIEECVARIEQLAGREEYKLPRRCPERSADA